MIESTEPVLFQEAKVGFICTTHQSAKHRVNGFELFNDYLQSLYTNCKHTFSLYAFDNASEDSFNIDVKVDNFNITRVDNQYKGGLTYTWNEGVKQAINDGCDIVIVTSDDQIIDETINSFIDEIRKHELNSNAVFGPLSNNANNINQTALVPNNKIFEVTDIPLNGFCLAMTKTTIESNYYDDNCNIFSTADEDKWGHQDQELQSRIKHSVVIGTCYLHHIKQGGWRDIRKADNSGLLSYE